MFKPLIFVPSSLPTGVNDHLAGFDVGVPRPRYGGDIFTCHRQVTNIQAVSGGEAGIIQYNGRQIQVYRRQGGHWETNPATLQPIKITYLR